MWAITLSKILKFSRQQKMAGGLVAWKKGDRDSYVLIPYLLGP